MAKKLTTTNWMSFMVRMYNAVDAYMETNDRCVLMHLFRRSISIVSTTYPVTDKRAMTYTVVVKGVKI